MNINTNHTRKDEVRVWVMMLSLLVTTPRNDTPRGKGLTTIQRHSSHPIPCSIGAPPKSVTNTQSSGEYERLRATWVIWYSAYSN